jgi:TIR domain-containing protein
VKHQVFISYPSPNEDIVENLASRLQELGIAAWVYSVDKTLAEEIEAAIAGGAGGLLVSGTP